MTDLPEWHLRIAGEVRRRIEEARSDPRYRDEVKSERCPDCGEQSGHQQWCVMAGMDDVMSSVIYGYPVCQCCHLRAGPERDRIHQADIRPIRTGTVSISIPSRKPLSPTEMPDGFQWLDE